MICFPNAKINLGLRVLRKRSDGYHDIESVFLPVPWCDVLEIVKAKGDSEENITWANYGLDIPGNNNDNLIAKAYNILHKNFQLPPVKINLLKQIPMGAGMGGGSADGAFAIKLLSEHFELKLSTDQLLYYAGQLGADCSFFIHNKPAYVQGVGEKLDIIDFKLPCNYICIVCPPCHISTAEAYQNMVPRDSHEHSMVELITKPIETWKQHLSNDFERYAFKKFPELELLKNKLYDSGARYASMTGSGSAVYGLFEEQITIELPQAYKSKWILPSKLRNPG